MFHSREQPVAPSWEAAGGMAAQKPGPQEHPPHSLKSASTSWAIGSQWRILTQQQHGTCPKCPKDKTDQCCVETGLEGSANKRLIEVSAVGQKERMVFGQQMRDALSGILTTLRAGRTEEEEKGV